MREVNEKTQNKIKRQRLQRLQQSNFCVELVFLMFVTMFLKIFLSPFSGVYCCCVLVNYTKFFCVLICIDNGNNEPRALFMVIVKLVALTVLILSAGTF